MRYKPSASYIKSQQALPVRIVLISLGTILLLALLMFSRPAPPAREEIVSLLLMTLFIAGIGVVLVRRNRRRAGEFASVAYALVDDGILVENVDYSYVIPYQGILGIVIKRRRADNVICQVVLQGNGGEAVLPDLDEVESFVLALRERLGQVIFREKHVWR